MLAISKGNGGSLPQEAGHLRWWAGADKLVVGVRTETYWIEMEDSD